MNDPLLMGTFKHQLGPGLDPLLQPSNLLPMLDYDLQRCTLPDQHDFLALSYEPQLEGTFTRNRSIPDAELLRQIATVDRFYCHGCAGSFQRLKLTAFRCMFCKISEYPDATFL